MRIRIMCCLVMLGTVAFSQRNLAVEWQTTQGSIESGLLKKIPAVLNQEDDLIFYKKDDSAQETISTAEIEWVVYGRDTVFLRQQHRGKYKLMQLLYQGEIRLYRVIDPMYNQQYYLVKGHHWELLPTDGVKESVYNILRQNCQYLKLPENVDNDYTAIMVAQQTNKCLGGNAALPDYLSIRQSQTLGIAFLTHIDNIANLVRKHKRYPNRYDRHPIFIPLVAVFYERQLQRNNPFVTGQLQLLFQYKDDQTSTQLLDSRIPASEEFTYAGLQLYPGLNVNSGYRRKTQFFLGAGPAFVIPLYSKRTVRLTDPNQSILGRPISQTFRKIIDAETGFYVQLGSQLRLHKGLQANLLVRGEYIRQWWRYYEEDDIFYTTSFPNETVLAHTTRILVQLQLAYSW